MKEISMKEAMRAVADGKCVEFETSNGSNGIIKNGIIKLRETINVTFSPFAKYYIKETVKVALFKSKNDDQYLECFTELDAQRSGVQEYFERASDWVEIEMKK